MTAHKHAALMAQYAQDAAETETPWRRWQVLRHAADQWVDCLITVVWDVKAEYRRKPRTMTYTVTIPEPLREAPEVGEEYYVAAPAVYELFVATKWCSCCENKLLLKRGLCFATKEDAIAAAKALCPFREEE